MEFTAQTLAKLFDHTALKATVQAKEIDVLCTEAKQYDFAAVCLNPSWIPRAVKALAGTNVMPITVVGFPLGAMSTAGKAEETRLTVGEGAQEVDMVIPVGAMLDGDEAGVRNDIAAVCKACGDVPLKVIIETCYLTPSQIKSVSKWCAQEGAAFVKTSTGFGTRGASVEDIRLMDEALREIGMRPQVKIKASGGIRDLAFVKELVAAGADRIGASASVAIMKELL